MSLFLLKRISSALLTVIFVSFVTFVLMNSVPGGPFTSEKAQSPATIEMLNKKYGLDKPILQRYAIYMKNFVKGDFGESMKMQKGQPVSDIIKEQFPTSAKIGIIAILFAVLIGITIGCLAAVSRDKFLDKFLMLFTTFGIAVPSFVIATLGMILFAVNLKILPAIWEGNAASYVLPVFALALYPTCYIARLSRSSMLDVTNQDYIRTAKAKGLSPAKTTFKHALRNSLIPVLTYLGPMTAFVLTGGFVVEKVFSIPGLGRYFIDSILNRDYPIIMATTIFLATIMVIMNLLVDIAYTIVDPRVKLK